MTTHYLSRFELGRRYGHELLTRARRPEVATREWQPPADVCESGTGLHVTVELGGVEEERFDICLYPDALIVGGVRDVATCPPGARYRAAEIQHGAFRVIVPLTRPVDAERADATYERGLLSISLPWHVEASS